MNKSFDHYRPYLAMLALTFVLLSGTIFFLRRTESPPIVTIATITPRVTVTPALVVVDVRGAVNQPGVYTLPLGSRVQDALIRAGNITESADTRPLNLARRLNDGEQIIVPIIGQAPPPAAATSSRNTQMISPATNPGAKININTASAAELDLLPGIGPAIAQRIIDYRNQNGDFGKVEDIKKVRGIGDVMFSQIKELITVQ
jgi:competence protein ComEA